MSALLWDVEDNTKNPNNTRINWTNSRSQKLDFDELVYADDTVIIAKSAKVSSSPESTPPPLLHLVFLDKMTLLQDLPSSALKSGTKTQILIIVIVFAGVPHRSRQSSLIRGQNYPKT